MDRLDFFEKDLNFERQEGRRPQTFTGEYQGYYVVFEVDETVEESTDKFLVKIGATIAREEQWFVELRNEIGAAYNVFLERQRHVLTALGKLPQKQREIKDYVESLLNQIIDTLVQHEISTGDFISGAQTGKIELYQINKHYNYLSEESFAKYTVQLAKEDKSDTEERSIQAGLSGAGVVALIGGLVWGLFVYLSWPSWLVALVMIHAAFVLYRKKGGLVNIIGTAIVTLLVILTFTLINMGLSFLLRQSNITMFSPELLVSIGAMIAYALIYAYGLYNAKKESNTVRKV